MYTMRNDDGQIGTAKTLNDAVFQIFEVKDAVIVHGTRIVAHWCSYRNTVRACHGALPSERASLGAS